MTSSTEPDHDLPRPAPSPEAWARQIADAYSRIALESSSNPLKAEANAAEASKYYGIADRMDRALPADEAQP